MEIEKDQVRTAGADIARLGVSRRTNPGGQCIATHLTKTEQVSRVREQRIDCESARSRFGGLCGLDSSEHLDAIAVR